VPDVVKHEAIESLAMAAAVELPADAPRQYAPMSWDELRAAERDGMSFGPHTVTHPILARATDVQARFELTESWHRLRAEARQPLPVFCYPNGRLIDFSDREVATLRALEFTGAVVGESGYAERLDAGGGADGGDPFRVRRFAYTEQGRELLQIVSGVEHVNQMLRGR
jgi:peptidoglycan/xylan/chitin deacetylase (PgdA/CDA1 family)